MQQPMGKDKSPPVLDDSSRLGPTYSGEHAPGARPKGVFSLRMLSKQRLLPEAPPRDRAPWVHTGSASLPPTFERWADSGPSYMPLQLQHAR